MAKKLNIGTVAAQNYTTKECLEIVRGLLILLSGDLEEAIRLNNVGYAGKSHSNVTISKSIIDALIEKESGGGSPTVL